uniref:Uncharacterized protein n=1 Tax=Romanomermis culicivorax TaxID=13658 RepID=A0A915HLT5_ROMCU
IYELQITKRDLEDQISKLKSPKTEIFEFSKIINISEILNRILSDLDPEFSPRSGEYRKRKLLAEKLSKKCNENEICALNSNLQECLQQKDAQKLRGDKFESQFKRQQTENSTLIRKNESRLEQYSRNILIQESNFKQLNQEMEILRYDLEKSKILNSNLKNNVESSEIETSTLREKCKIYELKIEEYRTEKISMEEKMITLENDYVNNENVSQNVNAQLRRLEFEKENLESRFKDLEEEKSNEEF